MFSMFQVRIAVVGNVDAGKSTLLGVLTHNILDDGRGIARRKLFRFLLYRIKIPFWLSENLLIFKAQT
jgi:GTPase